MRALSERERRFVDAYMGEAAGNGSQAARLAGYSARSARGVQVQASRLLSKPIIASAIAQRQAQETTAAIADRVERQQFWTQFMRDQASDPQVRLKASELLGKSNADFVERVHHTGQPAPQAVVFQLTVQNS